MNERITDDDLRAHYNADGCPKVKYRNYRRARDACTAIRRSPTNEHLHPYRCPVCQSWHIGHGVADTTYIKFRKRK